LSDFVIQGRQVSAEDLALIRGLLAQNGAPHRSALSRQLCELWNWRSPTGRLKDIAARSLLHKLDQRGLIALPARLTRKLAGQPKPALPVRVSVPAGASLERPCEALSATLAEIQPLRIERVDTPHQRGRVFAILRAHHYLGFTRSVGENVGYLIFDFLDRLLAVAWFGAPAWKAADRDRFIGWTQSQRESNLGWIANNVRFLVLPWVEVRQLASHVLGLLARRVRRDWLEKYGHAVALLETFIEEERFPGTCYRAANWIVVGRTTGRSRQDRYSQLCVPPKLIALLPLERDWRHRLLDGPPT
jgi:Druantia protein DruA